MANIIFEVVKTTKNKDAILCQNYVYNYKTKNLDSSIHYVCSHSGCYSSITILDGVKIKVDGKKAINETELSHRKHGPYNTEEVISLNFKSAIKEKVAAQSSLLVAEIYLQEQSKLIQKTRGMS